MMEDPGERDRAADEAIRALIEGAEEYERMAATRPDPTSALNAARDFRSLAASLDEHRAEPWMDSLIGGFVRTPGRPRVRVNDGHSSWGGTLVHVNDDDSNPVVERRGVIPERVVAHWSDFAGRPYIESVSCESCGRSTPSAEIIPSLDGIWLCLECDARDRRAQ